MQQTTNYNLLIPEGTDVVNPLTQVNPNFQTIDGAMFANKQASIGTASEVVTGSVHAINRNNPDSDVFRFTATGAWTAGDTMTLDGQSVTVHLADGTAPGDGAYVIGAEVVAVVNGTLVTLLTSSAKPVAGVTSFNTRTGAVLPSASDYDASMVDYDNTGSGLTATEVQSAIDELVSNIAWSQFATGNSATVPTGAHEVMIMFKYNLSPEIAFSLIYNNDGFLNGHRLVSGFHSVSGDSFAAYDISNDGTGITFTAAVINDQTITSDFDIRYYSR